MIEKQKKNNLKKNYFFKKNQSSKRDKNNTKLDLERLKTQQNSEQQIIGENPNLNSNS
jgi:hypothetical protein